MERFSDITNRNELADFLNIPRRKLTQVLYAYTPNYYYTDFEIPKKSGGTRQIHAPTGDLKSLQVKLAAALWNHQLEIYQKHGIRTNISHGFEKNKGIISNAKIHRGKHYVLNVDLEDFFECFHFGRVRGYFHKNREFNLPIELATVIAQLTCYNGSLPQGAPSSPIITNLICQILDYKLLKISKKYRLDYTRYADDLTFSTNDKRFVASCGEFLEELSTVIKAAGFRINNSKTRFLYRDSKQTVTGLIVNQKLNVDHGFFKQTKAMAHSQYSQGDFLIDGKSGSLCQLEGRFSFINQLDRYNNRIDDAKHNFRNLNGREKQYQQFLFYKYFFHNDKPLIVTEGKTDAIYLKSALKNLCNRYPSLICKNNKEEFAFNISFLKRTTRLEFLFGLSKDGADTMQNLYKYFTDLPPGEKQHFPNYLSYFSRFSNQQPKNPVIFLLDNEMANSKKPISKFVVHAKLTNPQKTELQTNLHVRLLDDSNLFLLTNPLVDDKCECEIEDLFDKEYLEREVSGRTFSRDDKYDIAKHYGKDALSRYVASEYDVINFTRFIPLLDCIDRINKTFSME